jgi:hypothetical protein
LRHVSVWFLNTAGGTLRRMWCSRFLCGRSGQASVLVLAAL